MVDPLSPERRSRQMARVRSTDTAPELVVRRLLHQLGYRFRVHYRSMPGTPDVAFPGRKKAIFVHGCFWHQHHCRRGARPTSNREFWDRKLDANLARDRRNLRELALAGWSVLVVWECELTATSTPADCLSAFLGPTRL